jgi:acyl-coenzyme A synthetase/AMP-(fatty) acid ligase
MVRRAAEGHEGVTLAAVPAMWRAWSEAGSIPKNTCLAISAGAPLSLALERTVHEREGLKIHNFYGSSECGGIAFDASLEPRETESLPGSPMNGVELAIGENGCLEVRGASVGEGYWPEAAPGLGGGVFRSADLAEFRKGQVHLLGRMADVINVAGRKLSPETVERELARHPGVAACVVFGVPAAEPQRVDDIVACVEVRDAVTMGELRAYLLERLPGWQVPRHWRAVTSLTLNPLGKVSRAEWRRRYLEREW